MVRLAYFLLGALSLYLLDYILTIYAEDDYLITFEGAIKCPGAYEWN